MQRALTGSHSDITYDHAHFLLLADEAIFAGIQPQFLQKLQEQQIYKKSREQYSTQGSQRANKIFACNPPFDDPVVVSRTLNRPNIIAC